MFQYFILKMDCTTDILEVWKELTLLNVNNIKKINNGLEVSENKYLPIYQMKLAQYNIYFNLQEQTLRLDIVYNKLLQSAQNDLPDYLPEKKMSKRQSSKYILFVINI